MKNYSFLYAFVFVFSAPIYSQQTLDKLMIEKQSIEKELAIHENSIKILKEKLGRVNREIGKIQLENQKSDGILVSIELPKPWLLNEGGKKIDDLFKGDTVRIIGYDQKTEKLKIYTSRYDTIGYLVPIAFGDNLLVKEYIFSMTGEPIALMQNNPLIKKSAKFFHYPSRYSPTVNDLDIGNLKVIDYQNNFFLIKSSNGIKGFVQESEITNSDQYRKDMNDSLSSKIDKHEQSIYIQTIFVETINSAAGVDFSLDWAFLDASKTIKYLYVSVKPYNSVGDEQKCEIRGHSLFEGKITGPISALSKLRRSTWNSAWYNNTITCLSIVKVKVEYLDGSSYTFINELPKISNPNLQNSCN